MHGPFFPGTGESEKQQSTRYSGNGASFESSGQDWRPDTSAFLNSISELAAGRYHSTREMVEAVLELLTDQVGMRSSFLTRIIPDKNRLEVLAAHNEPGGSDVPSEVLLELHETFCSLISGSDEPGPFMVEDARNDPDLRSHPAPVAFPNIGSYLGVPVIMSDGKLFGTLCAVDPEPQRLTESQINMLVVLSRIVATTIERDREWQERTRVQEEHSRLAAIVDSADNAIIGYTLDGTITSWNPAAERLYGYSSEEVVGRPLSVMAPAEYRDEPFDIIKMIERGNSINRYETVRVRKDGKRLNVGLNAFPVRDSDGNITGGSTIVRDITKLKRVENMLKRQVRLFGLIRDSIIVRDIENRITFWNLGAENAYGWTEEEALGQTSHQLLKTSFPMALREIENQLLRHDYWEGELVHARRDGSLVVVSSRWVLERDENGEPVEILEINNDITERKQREEEVARALEAQREANEKLERVNKIKSDFVSVVSHEFRTALTGIQGFSQMMRDEDFSVAEMKEFSGDIHEDSERLGRMITEMLDLDRMESGRMTLNLERVDLNELIATVTDLARHNAPKHDLRVQLEEGIVPFLADRDKLTQVLTNLLSNAVKYSPVGGWISVESRIEDYFAHVSIEDEGIGIAPGALERMFEPYSRVESENTRYIQGTGLGLAISRQIIRLHGGEIWAESEAGKGSTFHFTLPFTVPRTEAS